MSFGNADDFFKFVRDEDVKYVDVRFTDRTGTGLLTGAPGVRTCRDANGREREWIERSVPLLESERA